MFRSSPASAGLFYWPKRWKMETVRRRPIAGIADWRDLGALRLFVFGCKPPTIDPAASSADHHGFGLTDRRAHAASLEGIDHLAEFVEGHKLDEGATDLVPATAIGRMLSTKKAAATDPADLAADPETACSGFRAARGEAEASLTMRARAPHDDTPARRRPASDRGDAFVISRSAW